MKQTNKPQFIFSPVRVSLHLLPFLRAELKKISIYTNWTLDALSFVDFTFWILCCTLVIDDAIVNPFDWSVSKFYKYIRLISSCCVVKKVYKKAHS